MPETRRPRSRSPTGPKLVRVRTSARAAGTTTTTARALGSQKEFELFLEKCSAYGVMIPEDPTNVRSNLCELDPKQMWIVCDTGALLKFAKKMAIDEVAGDYPTGYLEDMLDRADDDD